ncbi:MAG: LysR family transcriptional regulator, partial [Pseudomonadota bacterium]
MSDRLRQIEAFLQVARTKNFTRAGNVLVLSQPALSA